jgi:hypothetical protein
VLAHDTGGLGWLNIVSGLISSVPTEAEYILKMMNVELLAGSALLVQSGALLVSQIGFNNFFASLQCTIRQPSYFNNTGGTSKGIMVSILPLKRLTDY